MSLRIHRAFVPRQSFRALRPSYGTFASKMSQSVP
jgi:hypothetical protein